jgi:hypothetical protein
MVMKRASAAVHGWRALSARACAIAAGDDAVAWAGAGDPGASGAGAGVGVEVPDVPGDVARHPAAAAATSSAAPRART